jgi:hypothetical protein
MESPWTGPFLIPISLDLTPSFPLKVEGPQITQIGYALASKNQQIGVYQLRRMISAFPRSLFLLGRIKHSPFFALPVED